MGNFFKKLAGIDSKKKSRREKEEEYELEEIDSEQEESSIQDNANDNDEIDDEEEMEDGNETLNEDDENDNEWIDEDFEEGQLSIDVYQTPSTIAVKSTIAGVKPEDIDISINNDMLTIRGKREECKDIKEEDYLYKECYWGSFSRSIILPVEVQANKIDAVLENGVLTVTLPKSQASKKISVKVKKK